MNPDTDPSAYKETISPMCKMQDESAILFFMWFCLLVFGCFQVSFCMFCVAQVVWYTLFLPLCLFYKFFNENLKLGLYINLLTLIKRCY